MEHPVAVEMPALENGHKKVKAPTTIDLERRLAKLEWCFAELVFKAKQARAQQLLADPAVQEQLQQRIMEQFDKEGM
jgi:hypothetical protein